jgi:hypothetical protein
MLLEKGYKYDKLPKTGLEPITVSYKETVLPIKLFRPLENYRYIQTLDFNYI